MATDHSLPRHRLILILALTTVGTLFVLKFVFDSYFLGMMETEAKAKIATPDELHELRADEQRRLTTSLVPIDKAMQELGSRGRESSPLIAPQQSTDNAPMIGWSKGLAAMAQPQQADAPSAAPSDDGGVITTVQAADTGVVAPKEAGH